MANSNFFPPVLIGISAVLLSSIALTCCSQNSIGLRLDELRTATDLHTNCIRMVEAFSTQTKDAPTTDDSQALLAKLHNIDGAQFLTDEVKSYTDQVGNDTHSSHANVLQSIQKLNQEYSRFFVVQQRKISQELVTQGICQVLALLSGSAAVLYGVRHSRIKGNPSIVQQPELTPVELQNLVTIADNIRRASVSQPLNPPLECDGAWRDIDEAIHSLCATVEVQEQFRKAALAAVVHDIRSPLASIRLFLDAASEGLFGELSAVGIERAADSVRLLTRLEELSTELLDLEKSRFAQGLKLSSVDLRDLVREAVAALEDQSQKRQVSVKSSLNQDEPLMIVADSKGILRVLINLISNAIKFSPKSTTVTIAVDCSKSDVYEISVVDSGPGVSSALADRLFAKFENEARTLSYKGYGLGLNIAKSIVEQHDGTIGYENLAQGTRFWFTLRRCDSNI